MLPFSKGRGLFDPRHPFTLTSDSSPNVYSQQSTGDLKTGDQHLVAGLVLSPSHYLYSLSGFTARRRCVTSNLARPIVAIFINTPVEMPTSLTDLGLASCLVVTDRTPDFTFPPVLDSHPSYDGSC